jgi:hypothetical protein
MPRPPVAGTSAVKPDVHYTLAEYRTWPDEERWELIDGIAYSMSPAPRSGHQRLVVNLLADIREHLRGKTLLVLRSLHVPRTRELRDIFRLTLERRPVSLQPNIGLFGT